MGVFRVDKIYIYHHSSEQFKEAHAACGDSFLNLKIDRHGKSLFSTYFRQNEPKTCKTKLPRF